MKRVWQTPVKVLAGLVVSALCALPQINTISARPGVINYVEGDASIDGRAISSYAHEKAFLNANDTLSTDHGRAEVLLTPGVFLRLGAESQVRMISPSLTRTQVEILKGDAMVEVAELLKENDIEVLNHGATIRLLKPGLYRVSADQPPVAQTFEGKAEVQMDDRKVDIGKNHQTVVSADMKSEKLNNELKQTDLYAWSKGRDEYVSAASFSAARAVPMDSNGNWSSSGLSPYAYGFGYGPGWVWNPGWSTWAWLPGNGAFFSPFGFGYFSPAYAVYAPVMIASVNGRGAPVAVPVNPSNPGIGTSAHHPAILSTSGQAWHAPAAAAAQAGSVSAPSMQASSGRMSSSSGMSHASSGGVRR